MIRVSVVMPAYNAAGTIGEAVASIRAQTLADFELILIDDGSADGTVAAARAHWGDDPRLRISSPGRVGLIQALQIGIDTAHGELIARIDADDIAAPTRLEAQLSYFNTHPEAHIIGCQVRCFPEEALAEGYRRYEAWQNGLLTHDQILREIFIESPLAHPSVMMKRQAIVDLGGYRDVGWPEDYDLWLRAANAGLRFGKVPEVLLHWRERPDRESRQHPRYSNDAFLRCKARHLAAGPLRERRAVVLWGGANVARRLGKLLVQQGLNITAFVDIDPKRIGGERLGAPVIAPQDLPTYREHFLIAAVGSRGARELIREQATDLGWREGVDFLCAA